VLILAIVCLVFRKLTEYKHLGHKSITADIIAIANILNGKNITRKIRLKRNIKMCWS